MKILLVTTSDDIIDQLNKNLMIKTRSYSTSEFHGGFWAKGQTYSGHTNIPSVNFVISNINYKLKFIVITNMIKTTLKRIAIFGQSRRNKVGLMNLKVKSML